MLLVRLLRFLLGYVCFSCSGGFCERFVNLCFAEGIQIWDIRSGDGEITACVSLYAYSRVGSLAEKAGMSLVETDRRGLPAFIKRSAGRWGLAAGTAAACVMVWFMTGTVWNVNVSGNVRYTDAQILSLCDSLGVHEGVRVSSVDVKAVQRDITDMCPGIIWSSVNIVGSRVFVEVRESIESPDMFVNNDPANLVAGVDGELVKLEVFTGEAQAKVGSAVLKGQLLISGVLTSSDGGTRFVCADGRSQIRCRASLSNSVSGSDILSVSDVKQRKSLSFFRLTVPFGISKTADDSSTTGQYAECFGVTLPIGIITDRYLYLSDDVRQRNENQLILLCGYGYFEREKELVKTSVIESRTLDISKSGGKYSAEGKYILLEQNMIQQTIGIDG